jgi:hypothetical protein
MTVYKKKLEEAAVLLSKYYGLPELKDLLSSEALKALTGKETALNGQNQDALIDTLLSNFINSSSGALTAGSLISKLNDLVKGNEEAKKRLNSIFEIYFTSANLVEGTTSDIANASDETPLRIPINQILKYEGSDQGRSSIINSNSSSPSKESPNLSVILSNSPRLSLTNKEINPVVIFLNGMPSVDMSRASPYMKIDFIFPGPPIGEGNRIRNLSLVKFLEGSKKIDSSKDDALSKMVDSSRLDVVVSTKTGKQNADQEILHYSTAGMEVFTSPQTLVNANTTDDPELHSAQVLDKFRPFMTLQSFDVSVVPSTGLMSYKSAELKLVLHDRSRLSDIADFVRPDLYGKTEIQIEYGWSYPVGNSENAYGNLINGMKVKEKFCVINSSFTFDDIGQVNINLRLAMKGAIDFNTEMVSSDSESFGNIIKEIEEFQKLVGDYKERIFNKSDSSRSKEIRGVQILDFAQDAMSQVNFNKEIKENLNKFTKELKKSKNPNATELIEALKNMFDEKKGKIPELRKTIQKNINNKVLKLQATGTDPFLLSAAGDKKSSTSFGARNIKSASGRDAKQEREYENKFKLPKGISTGSQVSLAKILLNFIAEPLANTKKFDDIQFVFYPFNDYAGLASKINIANFSVNLEYFTQELQRYRLGHIAKSGNMNLREFLDFLADTIIDDPAAPSYGLHDGKGSPLFKTVFNEDGTERSAQIIDNAADYQTRLENILKSVTPDGSFKMPQIDFYIESLSELTGIEDGDDSSKNTGKTILRIHVFDRHSTSYSTLGALLASSRDAEIESINNPEGGSISESVVNPGVSNEILKNSKDVIAAASQSQLLEPIRDADGKFTCYRIKGGPRELKRFMMSSMPYIMFGTAGSTIRSANLSSQQDSQLSTVNLLRSFNKSELQPNGENPGGLPMRIIPTELTIISAGCPLINFAQQFFIDFQTGTTADAIYAVSGLTHRIAPGEFISEIKLSPLDGWGRYMSLVQRVNQAVKILEDAEKQSGNTNN